MPFTSRKSRNATSNLSRANNTASSRLNPFDTLADEWTAGEKTECTSNHDTKQLVDLAKDTESFDINVPSDDFRARHRTTSKALETIREQDIEDVGELEKEAEQASKKQIRDNSNTTHESKLVAHASHGRFHSSYWRSDNDVSNSSTRHASRGSGAAMHRTGRGTRRGVSKIFHGIPVSELAAGVVIFHKETRECYDKNAEGDVFKSSDGQLHFRKGRFSVIEAVHAFTLIKSPMFTYQGKGIEKKREEVRKEHIGIRPLHIPSEQYVQQNAYAPLEVESMNDEFEQLHEKTALRFTERSTITFDTKIRIVGRLTAESVARLKRLRAEFGC